MTGSLLLLLVGLATGIELKGKIVARAPAQILCQTVELNTCQFPFT
jgi:hypothetical protein